MTAFQTYVGQINVKDYGAVGDGSANDTAAIQSALDAAFGTTGSPHGSSSTLNKIVYFPPGHYKTTAPLTMRSVFGGIIRGAGRFCSRINNVTNGSSVFVTNGFQYSRVEGLELTATGTNSVCFSLDWDNTGTALQSNTFADMFFDTADYGVAIGFTGYMGSENLFLNCFFNGHGVAGLFTSNYNALQNTVIGGNFQSCAKGIHVHAGSVPVVHGVGFQVNTQDIYVENAANDTMSIVGCRTESNNFVNLGRGSATISACSQTGSGIFVLANTSSYVTIMDCISIGGQLDIRGGGSVIDTQIGRDDWFTSNGAFYYRNIRSGQTYEASGTGTPATHTEGYVGWIGTAGVQYPIMPRDTTPLTVSGLPTASGFNRGIRLYVTDANATTFLSTVAGGGSNKVPVISDGTNWKIG